MADNTDLFSQRSKKWELPVFFEAVAAHTSASESGFVRRWRVQSQARHRAEPRQRPCRSARSQRPISPTNSASQASQASQTGQRGGQRRSTASFQGDPMLSPSATEPPLPFSDRPPRRLGATRWAQRVTAIITAQAILVVTRLERRTKRFGSWCGGGAVRLPLPPQRRGEGDLLRNDRQAGAQRIIAEVRFTPDNQRLSPHLGKDPQRPQAHPRPPRERIGTRKTATDRAGRPTQRQFDPSALQPPAIHPGFQEGFRDDPALHLQHL